MRVGILTWYRALNHGAVLQTYASCQTLKSFDAIPVVLDYKWAIFDEDDKKTRLLRRLRNFTPLRFVWYLQVKKLYLKKSENFRQFINNYLNVGKFYSEENELDAVYIGSDMVFDITEGYNPFMHGEGVPAPYIFSYAASFGYSTIEMIKRSGHYEEIKRNLSSLQEIGYRDQKTLELCKHLGLNIPMQETIDPVLCYGFEREKEEWDTGKWRKQKYILIYAYDSTMNDKDTISGIRKFAKENNLKIISCGYYHKWCDKCIPAAPNEFVEMFKHAQYIITDTFHGTVFSLLLHKQFATMIRGNGFKVQYLLNCANLESQLVSHTSEIHTILRNFIDFNDFENWISIEQKKSREFIRRNLERTKR